GRARLDHDGPRPLALHDLPARSLLGRDHRCVSGLHLRGDPLRPGDPRLQRSRPGRHRHRHDARGGAGRTAGLWVLLLARDAPGGARGGRRVAGHI
ncbi:MAG: hypothetical protein AVDCRST_MAG67-3633, partial [uncultured Solirubrobacteraceae bacterium]